MAWDWSLSSVLSLPSSLQVYCTLSRHPHSHAKLLCRVHSAGHDLKEQMSALSPAFARFYVYVMSCFSLQVAWKQCCKRRGLFVLSCRGVLEIWCFVRQIGWSTATGASVNKYKLHPNICMPHSQFGWKYICKLSLVVIVFIFPGSFCIWQVACQVMSSLFVNLPAYFQLFHGC